MKEKLNKAYYILPVLYCCVIGLFFYLHFFSYESETTKVGSITVTVRSPAGKNNRQKHISDFSLDIEPFGLAFSKQTPVTIELENGERRKLAVQEYTLLEDGLDLVFTEGLVMKVRENHNSSAEITFAFFFDRILRDNAVINIPYALSAGSTSNASDRIPVMGLNKENTNAFIIGPRDSEILTESSSIMLPLEKEGEVSFSLVYSDRNTADPLAFWFSKEAISISLEEYEETRTDFINKAYEGWKSSRFTSSKGVWLSGEDGPRFLENICTSALSESLFREEFARVLPLFQQAARKNSALLSYDSNPFFGNIPKTTNIYFKDVEKTLNQYKDMISTGNPSIFSFQNVPSFLMLHGDQVLLENFTALLSNVSFSDTDISSSLGAAAAVMELAEKGIPGIRSEEEIETMMETRVLPLITKTDKGIFLESKSGETDTDESLRTGLILQKAGEYLDSEIYLALGRSLVISLLNISDDTGFLPLRILLHDETAEPDWDKVIEPEDIYPYFEKNPYYPKEQPLYDFLSFG